MKNKRIDEDIANLPEGSREGLEIARLDAVEFRDSGKVDTTGEFTLFGQLHTKCKAKPALKNCFRRNGVDECAFKFYFKGENSDDYGGPYREALTNIVADELESTTLPMLLQTANTRNDHGTYRDCWVPNPNSSNPTHQSMFEFLGILLGFTIRTKSALDWHFPPFFWKQLLGEPETLADLEDIDAYSYQVLRDMRVQGESLDAATFNKEIDEKFVTYLTTGEQVVLCPGG